MTAAEPLLSIVEPQSAAAGNWLWLTCLSRTDDALYAGHPGHPITAVLPLQFTRVTTLDRSDPGASRQLAAVPDASLDYLVVPGVFEWWTGDPGEVLRTARRLLRPGGWLAVAGNSPTRGAPRAAGLAGRLVATLADAVPRPARAWRASAVVAALGQDGWREVRPYCVDPTYERPHCIVPRTRHAAAAREHDLHRQMGGSPLRPILAAAGMYDLLYAGWLVIASP